VIADQYYKTSTWIEWYYLFQRSKGWCWCGGVVSLWRSELSLKLGIATVYFSQTTWKLMTHIQGQKNYVYRTHDVESHLERWGASSVSRRSSLKNACSWGWRPTTNEERARGTGMCSCDQTTLNLKAEQNIQLLQQLWVVKAFQEFIFLSCLTTSAVMYHCFAYSHRTVNCTVHGFGKIAPHVRTSRWQPPALLESIFHHLNGRSRLQYLQGRSY